MRTLIIGSGTTEHTVAAALAAGAGSDRVLALAGNPGIAAHAHVIDTRPDPIALSVAAFKHGIDHAWINAAIPHADSIAAALAVRGVSCIGAGTFATRATASRAWTLDFLSEHRIPVAGFARFDAVEAATAHAFAAAYPLTVSADRPGSRTWYCRQPAKAAAALTAATADDRCEPVMLRHANTGVEVVIAFLTDGISWHLLPHCRDLQRPGTATRPWVPAACSPAREVTPGLEQIVTDAIVAPFHSALAASRLGHRGAVTARVALTPTGPQVLDLYPGLIDAYAPLTLGQLDSDLGELLGAIAAARAGESEPVWSGQHAVTVNAIAPAQAGASKTGGRDLAGTAVVAAGPPTANGDQHSTVVGTGDSFTKARTRALARAAWIRYDSRYAPVSEPAWGGGA
jgi:phosphoribosylamine---glycine ligase